MERYVIYCTEEQTRNALELGAPIEWGYHKDDYQYSVKIKDLFYAKIPTAEEMIGWLEERGFEFYIYKPTDKWVVDVVNEEFFTTIECDSRKEAILAAIDEAFDGLDNNDLTK